MPTTVLFDNGAHRNLFLEDFSPKDALAIQANQHLIIDDNQGMILDPGGHKIYSKVLTETLKQLGGGKLTYIFASHQDPDIVAALNGWLMTTDATAFISALWTRFVPHFGLDRLCVDRLKPIPDEGMVLQLGKSPLYIVPAHFLHSEGNFQVYDPVSKILYTGDLATSLGAPYIEATDWDTHLQYIEGFHRRYMTSNVAMRGWARMARTLDIDMIVPQHGAFFRRPLVEKFIDWCEGLQCGVDLMHDCYKVPVAM